MPGYLSLVRIGNVVVSFAGTAIGALAAVGAAEALRPSDLALVLLAGLSTACVTAGGNIWNDLGDLESDRTNHPDRPLVTGAVSIPSARALLAVLFVLSIAAVAILLPSEPLLGGILASAWLALALYERSLKSRGLVGNLVIAYLTGAVFLYGGAAVGELAPIVPFALMAIAATLSREVIKDMEDAGGDVERRTLPRTHGLAAAGGVAIGAAAVAIALSPWPLLEFLSLRSVAGIMYLAFVLAADALFVASVRWLPTRLHLEQSLSKAGMTIALLAFLAAAFR